MAYRLILVGLEELCVEVRRRVAHRTCTRDQRLTVAIVRGGGLEDFILGRHLLQVKAQNLVLRRVGRALLLQLGDLLLELLDVALLALAECALSEAGTCQFELRRIKRRDLR